MTTPTSITCPSCSHQFEPTAAMEQSIRDQIKAEFNKKWQEQKKKQEDDFARRELQLASLNQKLEQQQQELQRQKQQQEQEFVHRVDTECRQREQVMLKELEQRVKAEQEGRMRVLEEKAGQQEEALRESRRKEIAYLRKMEEVAQKEAELELDTQRRLMEERQRILEEVRRTEDERYKLRDQEHQMKMKELEKQLEDQRRLAEEALRKAEQGSMQLQGEVQELALEHLLHAAFPYDTVKEVGKGIRGADCILTVRNSFGQECGCIIFESKRTQAFGPDWIDKLKNDMVSCAAEVAVIVTQALPKDMDRFGERQGVYICTFQEVKSLVGVLRQAILKLYEARKSQENKGDKMVMLYDYLTGSEFMMQWNTMRETFQTFRRTLQKERDDFEKNWKKKEKLLEVIVNNSMQISGSIEGISGMESMNWTAGALPGENGYMLE